jgi:putative transposase
VSTTKHHDYLRRLPAEHYRGQAYVHWSLTTEDRKTGWLVPILYYKYREILTHTSFRFGLSCPIYCCMPDHIHLLWIGILDECDQRIAMRYFRKHLNPVLEKLGVRFQRQSFDHVLSEEDRHHGAFEGIAEYIARNPERRNLVATDEFQKYPYTGCLIPGYPELKPFENNYWDHFWKVYSHLRSNGLARS